MTVFSSFSLPHLIFCLFQVFPLSYPCPFCFSLRFSGAGEPDVDEVEAEAEEEVEAELAANHDEVEAEAEEEVGEDGREIDVSDS